MELAAQRTCKLTLVFSSHCTTLTAKSAMKTAHVSGKMVVSLHNGVVGEEESRTDADGELVVGLKEFTQI